MSKARHHAQAGEPEHRSFETTHWGIVLAAGRRSSPGAGDALSTLCSAYWYPLYAYVRRRVPDVHEAHDLTQAFFAELLEKNYVGTASPQRGRFRAFLLTSFKHFLSKEWDKAKAKKRGGARHPLPLDFASAESRYAIEPCSGLTAEQLYERQWAVTLLGLILVRLEQEFARDGKGAQFEALKGFIIGENSDTTYRDVSARLKITETAARMAAHRMRRRYRELLREEIAQTVASADDVEDEIRKLFVTLKM